MPAAVLSLPHPFELAFMQRALVEMLLLAVLSGVLGPWIVLRRLSFFTHGVGTAAFPGLVLAGPLGLAAPLAGFVAAVVYATGLSRLVRGGRVGSDAATALVLVGALAVGVVLASDVVVAGAGVDRLLFGSLIGLSAGDVWLTGAAVILVLVVDAALRRPWLAEGFDPGSAGRLHPRGAARADALLRLSVAAATVVALGAVGALLGSAVFVMPAATLSLLDPDLRLLRIGAGALAALEGVVALWLAFALNAPPGPLLAVIGGSVFALTAIACAPRSRSRSRSGAADRSRGVAAA